LGGHIGICLNLGITKQQLGQLLTIIETKIGKKEAEAGRQILEKAISRK
jgi:4-carboxymuconolactone decarboxylase